MTTKTKYWISWLLALMILFQPMSIGVFAASDEYVILDMHSGYMAISGVDSNSVAISSDESVARFENGHIQAYNCGVATITIGNKVYKVSVIASYPQPKTAKVNKAGVLLRQWGAYKTSDVITTLKKDEEITILGRVDDKTAAEGVATQYVETSNGKRGFIENKENTDRPIADYAIELSAGETAISGTYNGTGDYYQNQTFATSNNNITVKKNTDHSATITGVSEGLALFTSTGNNGVKTTAFVTVYSEASYTAVLNQKTVVKQGANESSRSSSVKQKGEIVTITGQCGDYWRIGQKQYVLKACADIQPEIISLDVKNATIKKASTYQLSANVSPNIAVKNITWTSDDESIATVDGNGLVTGIAAGEVTITATTANSLSSECMITVEEVMPTSIMLDCTEKTVNKDEVFTLIPTIMPSIALNTVTWASSDEDVAVVDDGEVIAVGAGKTTITATTVNGLTATCKVTVNVPATGIDIPNNHNLKRGDTYKIAYQLFPEDTTDKQVKWSSSDEKVVSVNSEGLVTAISSGEAIITASINGYEDKCSVNVYVPVEQVEMPNKLNLIQKATLTLTPKEFQTNASKNQLSWSTSDSTIATVDQNGKVTAVTPGKALITAKDKGGMTITCEVTVYAPVKTIIVPKYMAVQLGKTDEIVPTYEPVMKNDYNTYVWKSENNIVSVSGTKAKGTVEGKKQGVSTVSVTATSLSSADGAPVSVISGETFVSVYKKYSESFHVATKKANVQTYYGADNKTKDTPIVKKDTVLKVVGVSGDFYYVKVLSSPDKYRFVKKDAVEQITLVHKELLVNQKYNNEDIFKTGKNISVKSEILSGDCINLQKESNSITAEKCGTAVVKVKRKNNKTQKKSIYQIHFTVPNYTAKSIGYTNDSVNVYNCAKTSCAVNKLTDGTKVTVKAYCGERLKIEYTQNGKTKTGYVTEKKVSWIETDPMSVKEKQTQDYNVKFHNISKKMVANASDNNIIDVVSNYEKNGKYYIKVKGKTKGFKQLKITVGKYITYVPVSVYEPLNVDSARVNKLVNFRSGASSENENVINYRKFKVNRNIKILGKCNGFFYVEVNSKNIGTEGKGFLNENKVSYLKLNYATRAVGKNKSKKIVLNAYNTKANKVEWKNINGKVSFSTKSKQKKGNLLTVTYAIKGENIGTTNTMIKHKSLTLKDNCFVSVFKTMNSFSGFMKGKGVVRRGASDVSDNCPKVGERAKYKAVKVNGKSGDYYFIKYGDKKGFVLKSKVAYLSFKASSYTMKKNDTKKDIEARLINSNKDNKIKFNLNKEKLAEIRKVKETEDNTQKPHVYAKKVGKLKLTASYTNAGKVKIEKSINIRINKGENTKYPIVIVPGIMGSRLYEDKECKKIIWEPQTSESTLFYDMLNSEKRKQLLRTGENLKMDKKVYVYANNKNQVVLKEDEREYGAQETYKKLVNQLCELGKKEKRAVYFYSYDFRQSNIDTAKELNMFIDNIMVENSVKKVDLVAHSMGGLVVSNLIAQKDSRKVNQKIDKDVLKKINKIVTLGTPYEGAPTLINSVLHWDVLSNSFNSADSLRWSDNFLGIMGVTKEVKAGFPSIAQLAPTKRQFNNNKYYRPQAVSYSKNGVYTSFHGEYRPMKYADYEKICEIMFGDNFKLAQNMHDSISNNGNILSLCENAYFIVGTGCATIKALTFNSGNDLKSLAIDKAEVEKKEGEAIKNEVYDIEYNYKGGDGTVPFDSASMINSLPEKRSFVYEESHTGLVETNALSVKKVVEILQ